MWSQQSSGTTSTLYDVTFISGDTGFAVGTNGLILATATGGVVGVREDHRRSGLPDQTVLEQNYPNPFNPSTAIRFSLARSGFSSIKVFNIVGQEIVTLLNKKMSAGIYEG